MINNFSIFSDISLTNIDHSLLECQQDRRWNAELPSATLDP